MFQPFPFLDFVGGFSFFLLVWEFRGDENFWGESDEIGSIISPFLVDLSGKEGFVHGLWRDLAGFRRFWGPWW